MRPDDPATAASPVHAGWTRAWTMFALIVAGETVFVLPFVVARVFRTTFLSVFGLSNLQLGTAFSVYGVVAMASYGFGGPLADRFPARLLIALALAATAAGGLLFAAVPPLPVLAGLYGFWGLTSILLLWAALIRATREWGGDAEQGRAYGMLDGGRGLLAALLASATVALFAQLLPVDVAAATPSQRQAALRGIILICTAATMAAAVLAWFALPRRALAPPRQRLSGAGLRAALRLPGVWLQALIVVCAYLAYKVTDNFGLYAHDALGYDEVASARLGTVSFWVRPPAALLAGLLADRIGGSRTLVVGFGVLTAGALALGTGVLPLSVPLVLVATVVTTSLGIYGVRGVYFAVMGEACIPLAITGSAVGLVSVVGYTPDVFGGPLTGWLLDRSPGVAGHRHVFLMVAGFALAGLLASAVFRALGRRAA